MVRLVAGGAAVVDGPTLYDGATVSWSLLVILNLEDGISFVYRPYDPLAWKTAAAEIGFELESQVNDVLRLGAIVSEEHVVGGCGLSSSRSPGIAQNQHDYEEPERVDDLCDDLHPEEQAIPEEVEELPT